MSDSELTAYASAPSGVTVIDLVPEPVLAVAITSSTEDVDGTSTLNDTAFDVSAPTPREAGRTPAVFGRSH